MHVAVHRLLLPVQRLLQHQLRELVPVALRLHVQVEIVIVRYGVCAERVCANVRVEGVLHRETRPGNRALRYFHGNVRLGEAGRVVVDIHHLDLHAKQLQRARDGLLTDFLPVDFLLHNQCPRTRYRLEAASGKFGDVQPQILCNISNHRARLLLLRHGVVELGESSIQDGEQEY
uniref:Uncharacterized protein n=1 Tax=Salarias fasciatus TaxID=181472 RepID=A0A672GRI5_SALFA